MKVLPALPSSPPNIGKILFFSYFASPDYLSRIIDGVCRPYSK